MARGHTAAQVLRMATAGNAELLEKPAANLAVIVKDGVVYKSTIR